MSPLVLVVIFVVGMALVAARLIMGPGQPARPKKQKPARTSANRKPKRKTAQQRKPNFGKADDDLLEMFFDSMRDKR